MSELNEILLGQVFFVIDLCISSQTSHDKIIICQNLLDDYQSTNCFKKLIRLYIELQTYNHLCTNIFKSSL